MDITICYLFNIFIIASFAGWVYECIYCTLRTTRWQNRGFLFGPICPIYGFGFVGGKMFFQYLAPYLRGIMHTGAEAAGSTAGALVRPGSFKEIAVIFLVCAVGSAVLEYSTSYLLEKLFHARWWDYSHVPFNINGRICLPATVGFGAAGVVIVGYLLPLLQKMPGIRLGLFAEETIALLLMGVLSADLVLSVSAATRLLERIETIESVFDEKVEASYEPIGRAQRAAAEKIGAVRGEATEVLGSVRDSATEMLGNMKSSAAGRGRSFMERVLAPIQRNTLMNIARYSSERHQGTAGRIKEFLAGKQKEKHRE